MSINFADIVVLGDDLSGIAAGSLLAKRGLNVLVVDQHLATQPQSLAGLGSRVFRSLVGKIGIAEPRLKSLRKNPISFQVILPDHRIDVTPNTEQLLREFEREFPSHIDWAKDFFEEIEETYDYEANPLLGMIPWINWRERRRFLRQKNSFGWPRWSEELTRLPMSLQAFLKAWILFLSDNPTSFADAFQAFSLLTEESRTTVTVKSGLSEIKQLFLEKIEYFGGTILPEPPSDYEFETKSSNLLGISFDAYHFSTRCRYLLGNESISKMVSHIPQNFRTRRYCRSMRRNPSSRAVKIQFLISSAILPELMCQDVLLIQDESQPLIGTNYLRVQVIELPNPLDEQEDTLLQVSYFLPTDEPMDNDPAVIDRFESRHEWIEKNLRKLIPFSKGKLRRIFPIASISSGDLFDDPTEDYAKFFQQARVSARYPPSISFPGLKTPYNNFYTLGPDQLGWLGLSGRLQGAMKVVDCIWARESKGKGG